MEIQKTVEYNSSVENYKVLVASQGSEFKEFIVESVIQKHDSIYFKVVDISELKNENIDNWNALVIIHTWEYFKPPEIIKTFFENNTYDASKTIVLTTSGRGSFKMDKIDAISGASIVDDIPIYVKTISDKLVEILKK